MKYILIFTMCFLVWFCLSEPTKKITVFDGQKTKLFKAWVQKMHENGRDVSWEWIDPMAFENCRNQAKIKLTMKKENIYNAKCIIYFKYDLDFPRVSKVMWKDSNGAKHFLNGVRPPEIPSETIIQAFRASLSDETKMRFIQEAGYECTNKGFSIINIPKFEELNTQEYKTRFGKRELKLLASCFKSQFATAEVIDKYNIKVTLEHNEPELI